MSDGNEDEGPREPRRPTLQGLLNFCTEITAREDSTNPTELPEMDAERRAFLEEALSGMNLDVAKHMTEAVKALYSEAVTIPEENVTEQEDAMDVISEFVEDLNHAIDFHKIGGFPALLRCLNSPHVSLRIGAANLMGEICQNQLYCQEHMLSLNPIPVLLQMMDNDDDTQARIKALFALSCLVRGYPDGESKFLELDGFSYLMRAMQSGVDKLVVKSAFTLNHFIVEDNFRKDTIISMGYVEQLASILSNDDIDDVTREHCTSVLATLTSSCPPALSECLRPELNLPGLLRSRLSAIKGDSKYEDEERHILTLLRLVERDADTDVTTCR